MPLVGFRPKTELVEAVLDIQMEAIRQLVKEVIGDVSGFPHTDVLVTLHKCDVRNPDPDAAECVVHIDTCPNEHLETHANELRDKVAQVLISLGVTSGCTFEVWPKFLPGPWCQIRDGNIVDTVDH